MMLEDIAGLLSLGTPNTRRQYGDANAAVPPGAVITAAIYGVDLTPSCDPVIRHYGYLNASTALAINNPST